MSDMDRKDLLEVIEERYMDSATVVASQVPIKEWYQVIGESTIADAICDRLMHNAYKLELKGESLRKKNNLK